MSYAKIVAKKIRMCARFGHLPENHASRPVSVKHHLRTYVCHRCGSILGRQKGARA